MSRKPREETSLVVQWLRFHAPNAGGLGWIPGQGTRACMSQLKDPARGNETKTRRSQISLKKKKKWPRDTGWGLGRATESRVGLGFRRDPAVRRLW